MKLLTLQDREETVRSEDRAQPYDFIATLLQS